MKPTAEQVQAFANADLAEQDLAEMWAKIAPQPPEPVPGPYQLALTFTAALLSSGRYGDDPAAAAVQGWLLVTPFYQGKRKYEENAAQLAAIAQHARQFSVARDASPTEPQMSRAEAAAYVTGGETGDFGEGGGRSRPMATVTVQTRAGSETIDLAEAQRRQQHIADCNKKVADAELVLAEARAALDAAKPRSRGKAEKVVQAAEEAFVAACAEQSAAYL